MLDTIRSATDEDTSRIIQINRAAVQFGCKGFYEPQELLQWAGPYLDNYYNTRHSPHLPKSTMLVAERGGVVTGFGQVIQDELYTLFIDPDCAGQGIGKLLFQSLMAKQKFTRISSTRNAVAFYEKRGFIRAGTLTNVDLGNEISLELVDLVAKI